MIQLTRNTADSPFGQYVLEPETMITRALLDAVLSWPEPAELADLAVSRRGFGDIEAGFGVVYHGDLNEYERVNYPIREGFVQVYGFYGPPEGYEHEIEEDTYLEFLSAFLRANGLTGDADRVDGVRAARSQV